MNDAENVHQFAQDYGHDQWQQQESLVGGALLGGFIAWLLAKAFKRS